MQIELTAPACLHLGFGRFDGQTCELGIALQHPPIQLLARPTSELIVSGARADLAYQQAAQFLSQHQLPQQGAIEIELAIPAFMGLGSDEMLRASVERSLGQILHVERSEGTFRISNLFSHAFDKGGLILVNSEGELRKRAEIAHTNEADDWVFVLVLPHTPDDITDDFEAQRAAALRQAAQHLNNANEVDQLWLAIERDDLDAFASSLATIHDANEAALAESNDAMPLTEQDNDILDFMRANGAAMCGRALTGLGLYGLIKGGKPSRDLRAALTKHLSYFGPLVMATICDNQGAKIKIHD